MTTSGQGSAKALVGSADNWGRATSETLTMNIDTNNFSYINCIFGSNLEIYIIDRKVSSTKNLRGCYTIFLKPIE
jgi:hypothetical protein